MWVDGAKLRAARLAKDWSQDYLAKKIERSGGCVSTWERFGATLPEEWVEKLSDLLEVMPYQLIGKAPAVKAPTSSQSHLLKPPDPEQRYNRTGVTARNPGFLLNEYYVQPLGLRHIDVSRKLKMPKGKVDLLLQGQLRITASLALLIQRQFGLDARLLLGLQAQADLIEEERFDG